MNRSVTEQVPDAARMEKAFQAEKKIALARGLVIVAGTITFFFLDVPGVHRLLALWLLPFIWLYGALILFFRPYQRYPVMMAASFTYVSDCLFATMWIYATGSFYSPYFALYYTSILAVAFRFGLRTVLFTCSLYSLAYVLLLWQVDRLHAQVDIVLVRLSFLYIIGYMGHMISSEVLSQAAEKINNLRLAEKARDSQRQASEAQDQLREVNRELMLRNTLFGHAEENAAIGSYSWNLATNVMHYSDNLYRLMGYEPGEFTPSLQRYRDMVHPDDQHRLNSDAEQVKEGHAPENAIHRVITKSGALRYFRATARTLKTEEGPMLIGTLQDVTTDIKLQEDLEQKNEALERSNSELASFNYIASHDLQEPVRKIHTFSRLILDRDGAVLTDSTRGYLGRISAAANRMQNLIEAFLNYARLDGAALGFSDVDLGQVVRESVANLSDLLEEKQGKVEWSDLPHVQGQAIQLQQVFINLISNSLKYSRRDVTPRINISAEKGQGRDLHPHLRQDAIYWTIRLEDNGIGFEPEYGEKIFEVFQRLHSKDQYAGTGIGLAICRKIALVHHGYITATAIPGEGATFLLYLPA